MSSLKSIVGLVVLGLLVIPPGHAQDGETCPYPKRREIQDLAGAIKTHKEWLEKGGWRNPEAPGRLGSGFCLGF